MGSAWVPDIALGAVVNGVAEVAATAMGVVVGLFHDWEKAGN